MTRTRSLDAIEIRVLGALLEKEQTTPDQYPLTINATIAACNQKTNREPVTQLTETEVVEALDRLRLDVLTWRHEGTRAERWEQRLDRRWQLDSARKAIMTLLLLRGPQTPGELKTRAERMHHFDTKEDVEKVLSGMSEGLDALVEELPRAPGQRDNRWLHLAGTDEARQAMLDAQPAPVVPTARPAVTSEERGPSAMERLEVVEQTVKSLQAELRALRIRLGDLDAD